MSPQNPKDPNDLSLRPSKSARTGSGTPDFSNVQGRVDTVPGGGGAGEQSYTVQKGDTLSAIAHRHYGKASRWHAIFEANRDQLDNPDLIQPGQVLKLPAIDD
jgi:nucleoid-associated protein YgaU